MESALYPGHTWHRRYRPKAHFLRYDMLMMLIDLDEASALDRSSRWFGYNRARLISLRDRDHLSGSDEPLRQQVDRLLVAGGFQTGGRVQLLCMPRILGQVFNPLSVYFCYPTDGDAPMAVLYEVNNTFGDRHSYLLAASPDSEPLTHGCNKRLYVSPFMDMAQRYRFRLRLPATLGDPLGIDIEVTDQEGRVLSAAFIGKGRAPTDPALLGAALAHPLLMLKVVGAIHWEALKLWLKGMRLRRRPPAPSEPVSVG
jgi:DUF1365 family protein